MYKKKKQSDCNMLCAYCNAKWSGNMITKLIDTELNMGYYDDIESVEVNTSIKIFCDKCGKLLYEKEIINKSDL